MKKFNLTIAEQQAATNYSDYRGVTSVDLQMKALYSYRPFPKTLRVSDSRKKNNAQRKSRNLFTVATFSGYQTSISQLKTSLHISKSYAS